MIHPRTVNDSIAPLSPENRVQPDGTPRYITESFMPDLFFDVCR